jgi:hypothetical protein
MAAFARGSMNPPKERLTVAGEPAAEHSGESGGAIQTEPVLLFGAAQSLRRRAAGSYLPQVYCIGF